MSEDIIGTIKEAERQAAENEKGAREAADAAVRDAALSADKRIKEAEANADAAIRAAKEKGTARAAEIKKKHEEAAYGTAEELVRSAMERKNDAVETVVQELIGKWQ
ncbi:MAG: hypothetical protein IJK58_03060 [Clostridia bacterium]|nr:hypothetical protein [Clostridia bacterium]